MFSIPSSVDDCKNQCVGFVTPLYHRAQPKRLFFNGNDAIGTHCCAKCTANTALLLLHVRGRVTLGVQLVKSYCQALLGASIHAQAATLTHIGVKRYLCHIFLLFKIIRDAIVKAEDQNISFAASREKSGAPVSPPLRFFRRYAAIPGVRSHVQPPRQTQPNRVYTPWWFRCRD